MHHSTSNTYQIKREILNFTKYLSKGLSTPDRKFMADMNYGILASGSCLLTDIADQLHEPSKTINIVDRLSRHLSKGISPRALQAYLTHVKQYCPSQPVIHIDDSDTVMLLSLTATSLKPSAMCGTVPKVPPLKMFTKKAIMLQRLPCSPGIIILSASFRRYIPLKKIEEYYRCKKQMFQFENFRVRKLTAINALNYYLLSFFMYGISVSYFHEGRYERTESIDHKDCKSDKKENCILLLPACQRDIRHPRLCKRRCSALVPDETSGIPPTLP